MHKNVIDKGHCTVTCPRCKHAFLFEWDKQKGIDPHHSLSSCLRVCHLFLSLAKINRSFAWKQEGGYVKPWATQGSLNFPQMEKEVSAMVGMGEKR